MGNLRLGDKVTIDEENLLPWRRTTMVGMHLNPLKTAGVIISTGPARHWSKGQRVFHVHWGGHCYHKKYIHERRAAETL